MNSTEDRPEEEWLKDLEEAKYLEQTAHYLLEDAENLRKGAYEWLKRRDLERESENPEWVRTCKKLLRML